MEIGKVTSFYVSGNEVHLQYEKQEVIVTVITPEIVNVFVPCWQKEHLSKAVEGDKTVPCVISTEQQNDTVCIGTDKLSLRIGPNLKLEVTDAGTQVLFHTYEGERVPLKRLSDRSLQQLAAEGHEVSSNDDFHYPVQMVCALDEGDDFYGLGDKSGFLNKK